MIIVNARVDVLDGRNIFKWFIIRKHICLCFVDNCSRRKRWKRWWEILSVSLRAGNVHSIYLNLSKVTFAHLSRETKFVKQMFFQRQKKNLKWFQNLFSKIENQNIDKSVSIFSISSSFISVLKLKEFQIILQHKCNTIYFQ